MDKPFLELKDLVIRYDRSKRTLNRWMNNKENPFPPPDIRQSGMGCLWRRQTILDWESGLGSK